MTANLNQKVSEQVRKFVGSFKTPNAANKLVLAACTLELFRQAQKPAKNPEFFRALADFAKVAERVNWGAIPFSFTREALVNGLRTAADAGVLPNDIDALVLEAVIVFSDLIDNGLAAGDCAPADIFDAIVLELAEAKKTAPPAPVKKDATPEVYNERMLARVFKPAQFSEELANALSASLVIFKDVLPNGDSGPSLRGIAFDNGTNTWHILLESGEFVRRQKDDECVRVTNTVDDFAAICPALLAFSDIAAPALRDLCAVLDLGTKSLTDQHCFGAFTKPLHTIAATKETVASLENVIDAAHEAANLGITGATGPHGASVRFAVPDTDFVIVLDALTATAGPYVVARLLSDDRLVMRLEYPRQFSARGVYMFPLPQCVVALTVLY